jgi:hypothetical protein
MLACFVCLVLAGTALSAPDEEGFVPLFDGKTLTGWEGATTDYVVEEGTIVCKGGNLYTDKDYGDFVLRLEFKLPEGGNNGVGIRTPFKGHASNDGMEIQILDDDSPKYAKLQPYQYCGSIYGIVPAKRGHLKKPGEWNEMEITCRGSLVTVKINSATVADADVSKFADGGAPDKRPHPGLKRTTGRILFCGHGSPVAFRNIRIKEFK